MTIEQFGRLTPDHSLTLPTSVIEMFMGSLGEPEGGWPEKLQKIILRGAEPQTGRPGAYLPDVDIASTAEVIERKIGRKPAHDEVLSYLMYPDVFVKYAQNRQSWGDVDVLPTAQFYYGMKRESEVSFELEPGKAIIIRFLTVGDPTPTAPAPSSLSSTDSPAKLPSATAGVKPKRPHGPRPTRRIQDRSAHPSPA